MIRLPYRWDEFASVLAGITLALPCTASAQSLRLSGPLAQPGTRDVTIYAVTPDGTSIVYIADQDADEVFELYRAPSDGSSGPVRLNPPLVAGGDVADFALGERVVYLADQETDQRAELYSVPYEGGPATKLSPLAAEFSAVTSFLIAPDGTSVLFVGAFQFYSFERLYRVPIDRSQNPQQLAISPLPVAPFFYPTTLRDLLLTTDGSRVLFIETVGDEDAYPLRLLQVATDGSQPPVALVEEASAFTFGHPVVSQDGSRVVYADLNAGASKLFTVAIDGSQNVQVNPASTQASDYHITPDGSRVVYLRGNAPKDVYSVLSDGTGAVQLDPPATAASTPRLVPDGSRVVFVASGNLYSAPVDGAVSATLLAGPGATSDFVISADSSTVVAVLESASFRGLYRVPTAGGASPVLLNGPVAPQRGVAAAGQKLALSGARVVYRQDRQGTAVHELYSVLLDGSAPEELVSATLSGARDVQTFQPYPDGLRVAYLADQANDETFEVFSAPLDGGAAPVRHNAPFGGGPVLGDVLALRTAADESRVIFRADQDSDEVMELFAVRTDGRFGPSPTSGQFGFSDDVLPDFERSAAGQRIVYQRDTLGGGFVLFSTRDRGRADPIALDEDGIEFPAPLLITPDESRVLYRKELMFGNRFGLYSHRLDGIGAPVRLNPGAILESSVSPDVALTPAGERAVYRADDDVDAVVELFSVASDGSAAPVQLNGTLVAGGTVQAFRIAPDGARVYYRADQDVNGRDELFGVGAQGGTPVRMHAPLASDRDVTDFAVAPDSQRVVFRSDLTVDAQNELYSVPSSGPLALARSSGGPVVRLTPLATGEDVATDFRIHPGQVLFRAGTFTRMEVYRVPIDGSEPPLRLNDALVTGGNVTSFAASPDGAHVVYLADQRTNDAFELFSVPLDGGPGIALDAPSAGDVVSFRIAPDSGLVVFLADREVDEVFELYAAPLDGSAPVRKLNGTLTTGGDVQSDFAALSGGRALYRADQDANDVFELFLGGFERGPLEVPAEDRLR